MNQGCGNLEGQEAAGTGRIGRRKTGDISLTGLLMKALLFLFFTATCCTLVSCKASKSTPPKAKQVPTLLEAHGRERVDEFYWLRERDNPEVRKYLEEENSYTEAVMSDVSELRAQLLAEMQDRIPSHDETAPVLQDGSWYLERFEEGSEYPVYLRRNAGGSEEVLLDANAMAEGFEFFSVRSTEVSTSGRFLAYAVDTVGRRKYHIRFRDLETGDDLADEIGEVTPNLVWANDDQTLFYVKQHPETLRSYQVYRHRLGTDAADDQLVYEETDETFAVSVEKTRSRRFILIHCRQTMSDEVLYLDADHPAGTLRVVQPRIRGLEYSVDHAFDNFIILTNHEATNFKVMTTPVVSPEIESWMELVPARDDVLIAQVAAFAEYLAVVERRDGIRRVHIVPLDGAGGHEVEFSEQVFTSWIDENRVFDSAVVRLGYSSLTTPDSFYDYEVDSRQLHLVKRDEVVGDFSPEGYVSERLHVPARDGVQVPVSLVHRKDITIDGSHPLLLYAYGSYGYSIDPRFDLDVLSLLDRGFVYAIAHVRGGQELGRNWYETGRQLDKKNTFTDFVDCARFLIDQRYASADKLFARGGSAGGLLVGAVANMAPELFAGVIAEVPFVDVITTMLDDDIPLTTSEYDEWGNPNSREHHDYMLSYSPYDNVQAKAYPNLLVTAGLHDSQVQYWEPAKWVARLRQRKTDHNLLLLRTNMDAGHGGATGRFKRLEEEAFIAAFMLKILG